MSGIIQAVGVGAPNRPGDVRVVQEMLNRRGGSRLRVDGLVGPRTSGAIMAFQSSRVGLKRPDGRVDPNGPTWRVLRGSPGVGPRASGNRSTPSAEARREQRRRHRGFVRPGVRETAVTRSIIDAIAPAFEQKRATVISGYMNSDELVWKVNYHWEYLLWMLEHSVGLKVSEGVRRDLRSLIGKLQSVAPRPATGYRTGPVGKPVDQSSMEQITARHRAVAQSKNAFKSLIVKANLKRLSSRTAKAFDYAVAPVAHPGTSKHSTGYAIDISGDNALIRNECRRLGASLVFDEKSHVHVEFKHGVKRSSP